MNATASKPFGSYAEFRARIEPELAPKRPPDLENGTITSLNRSGSKPKAVRRAKRRIGGYHVKF